jgi:alpha-tubulin suppressor-like RCC1 family protein
MSRSVKTETIIIRLLIFQLFLSLLIIISIPALASSVKFVAVSTDATTTLALDNTGNVWLWGTVYDQIGSPAYDQNEDEYQYYACDTYQRIQATPIELPLNNIIAISGGDMALMSNGTVWTWGSNINGQLGDGTYNSTSTPVEVQGLDNVIAISSLASSTCLALKSDGSIWAWGQNDFGQCGDGDITYAVPLPVEVKGLSNVTAIYGGAYAVEANGSVWTWGATLMDVNSNGYAINYGSIGSPKINCNPTPIKLNISNVKDIDYGTTTQQTVFVADNGTVWNWGYDLNGTLGDGTLINPAVIQNIPYLVTPIQVKGLTNIINVTAGVSCSMALKNDGTVWAWGYDCNGQFGDGKINDAYPLPIQLPIDNVVAMSGGNINSVFLKSDGSVWACGDNSWGSVGYGNTSSNSSDSLVLTPVRILGLDDNETSINSQNNTTTANKSVTLQNNNSTTQPTSTPVPSPGFDFNTMMVLGCTGILAGLVSGLVKRKK